MKPRGSRIADARQRLGWKRSELARRVQLSYQHIYNVECGFMDFSIEAAHRIANELGLSLEDVAEPEQDKPQQGEPRPVPTSRPEPVRPVAPPRPTKTKSASAA